MHVIAAKAIREFARKYSDARKPLMEWLFTVEKAQWTSIGDVRRIYPHADAVKLPGGKSVYIFNIKGNRYRLIVAIHFNRGKVYVLHFLTHADYDRQAWKDQL